jgi:hypothetical protein
MATSSRFSESVRSTILHRAGLCCEKCGTSTSDWSGWSVHHRRPAGMGGDRRPEVKTAANGLLLCGSGVTGCHGWVESNRDEAYERGLLLRRHQIPVDEPVQLRRGRVLLDDEGNYIPTEGQAA